MALRYIMSRFPTVALSRSLKREIYILSVPIAVERASSTGTRYGNRVSIGRNERAVRNVGSTVTNVSALVIVRLRVYKGIDIFTSIAVI